METGLGGVVSPRENLVGKRQREQEGEVERPGGGVGSVGRGTQGAGTTRQLRVSLGTFGMPVLPPECLVSPFLTSHGVATPRLCVPLKQCRRQNDADFVLPSYEQLLQLQHAVTPRGSSCHSVPRSITPPAPHRHRCPSRHLPRQIVESWV